MLLQRFNSPVNDRGKEDMGEKSSLAEKWGEIKLHRRDGE